MKNYKIFTLAACLLAVVACNKEKEFVLPGGLDASKPAVASLNYDAASSGAKTAGFTWDADQALSAGATSFTLELTADISTDKVENGTSCTIVYAPETAAVVEKGIVAGKFYYARIRANYEGYYYSNWTYLGSASSPLAVLVGTGAMEATFSAPTGLTAVPSETSFKASWDATPFADFYTFEYKAKSASEWSVISELKTTNYEVEGLVGETTYDYRVKAHQGQNETEYSTSSVTTLAPSGFKPEMASADAFIEFLSTEAALASNTSEYSLEADIDLSGKTLPASTTFKGILDGKGHAIKGLALTAPIFSELNGTVKNLVLEGTAAPAGNVFGVVAAAGNGKMSKVTNKVAVTYAADVIKDETLIAGLLGNGSVELSECVNEGAITVTSASGIVNIAVGGVAAKASGTIDGCSNTGVVTVEAQYCSIRKNSKITVDSNYAPCVGGLVGYALTGFAMTGCSNSGNVVFKNTAIDKGDGAVERIMIGGVVGSTDGPISKCSNSAKLELVAVTTTGAALTGSGTSYIICAGGIGGGDYYAGEGQTGTTISECTNSGEINLKSDAANANSTLGGIVGWPGVEGATSTSTATKCTNTGKIVMDGVGKVRIGGIAGGSGHITDCSCDCDILVNNCNSASVAAFICGFHTQNHVFTGNIAKGKLEAKAQLDGAGGLLGGQGNQKIESGTGCKANCTFVTTEKTVNIGLVVGKISSGANAVVLGTADNPIKIKGNVNGTEVTADNYDKYIGGNYPLDNKTIYAAYGE